MVHANARTNLFARRLMVERVAAGWPAAHVAEQLGVSRATVYKWLHRYAEAGEAASPSRPARMQRGVDRGQRYVDDDEVDDRQDAPRSSTAIPGVPSCGAPPGGAAIFRLLRSAVMPAVFGELRTWYQSCVYPGIRGTWYSGMNYATIGT